VRIVEPMLDVLGIPYRRIARDADVQVIAPGVEDAYARSKPIAFLIERRPVHA
jgi:hypothetical protein